MSATTLSTSIGDVHLDLHSLKARVIALDAMYAEALRQLEALRLEAKELRGRAERAEAEGGRVGKMLDESLASNEEWQWRYSSMSKSVHAALLGKDPGSDPVGRSVAARLASVIGARDERRDVAGSALAWIENTQPNGIALVARAVGEARNRTGWNRHPPKACGHDGYAVATCDVCFPFDVEDRR